ncbi:MAG: BolA family protein [Cyanophyceae cyanobacterium]
MNIAERIQTVLEDKLEATAVKVQDDSHLHAGHAGRKDPLSSGGHYTVWVASDLFEGRLTLQRHRLVYDALAHEMGHTIHALSLHTLLPDQWEKEMGIPLEPTLSLQAEE